MNYALYLNGIYESVLDEIVKAQNKDSNLVCYLQPYSPYKINWINSITPTIQSPIDCYISTTASLPIVTYKATIVSWEHKDNIKSNRLDLLNAHIKEFQPGEEEIYLKIDGKDCANLLSVVEMQKLEIPLPVQNFIKVSDSLPLKKRTRSGGWSYVNILPNWIESTTGTIIADDYHKILETSIEKSKKDTEERRKERLREAPKVPESFQIVQRGFKRNPDVIASVLARANGVCEKCKKPAPFIRASNNTPYLEIHHRVMLSQDGEDTEENAMAVCPNCHKELHFGIRV
jgi:predicted HNH restriction endonuclease